MTSAATANMPSTRSSSREIAESEDIYFGGGGGGNHHRNVNNDQKDSLLGQALQLPTLGVVTSNNNDDDDDDDIDGDHEFHENLTPTFVTRKRSTDAGGNRTPLSNNYYHCNNSSSTRNNNLHSHQNSFSSMNRALSNSSSADPLSMSTTSLQSEDIPAIVPQSVDTVPTSNVGGSTYHQYQQQQALYNRRMMNNNLPNHNGFHNNNNNNNNNRYPPPPQRLVHNTSPQANNNKLRMSVSPPTNLKFLMAGGGGGSHHHHHPTTNFSSISGGGPNDQGGAGAGGRRTVFGSRVQKRYPTTYGNAQQQFFPPPPPPLDPAPFYNIIDTGEQITFRQAEQQPPEWETLISSPTPRLHNNSNSNNIIINNNDRQASPADDTTKSSTTTTTTSVAPPLSMVVTASTATTSSSSSGIGGGGGCGGGHHPTPTDSLPTPTSSKQQLTPPPSPPTITTTAHSPQMPMMQPTSFSDLVSPLKSPLLTSPTNAPYHRHITTNQQQYTSPTSQQQQQQNELIRSSTTSTNKTPITPNNRRKKSSSSHHKRSSTKTTLSIHETVHAQSLLLGLCFMAIWSPNNIMAPNLTQIATFYDMTENERDLYLGSFLALATGVLSFPLSAAIGILTDLYSRKRLFVGTAIGGALASVATGCSPTYRWLLLARFFSGGFMSASVSVSFSLLGDLFATEERNAASSGLTAMMGLGIILGQVYAGIVGNSKGWQQPFWVSGAATAALGLCVALMVQEPVRGGKEKVLQDLLKQGKRYDRKLTWEGFWNAMSNNRSNGILMAQGFFSSLPWGVIFVFLNDYLSQERGFSVPDATFIVLVFGIGCAVGGIIGGYLGARIQSIKRSFLPLFMAATTILAALPFIGLLNGHTTNAHGYWAVMYSFMGGCLASMPSVNVRPCLINVNPPETRGASLTAANLIINVARGVGPSCITLLGSSFDLSRQSSFNITLIAFWAISALQLCMLAKTLPKDQDEMEAELARYAASALARVSSPNRDKCFESASSVDEFSLPGQHLDSCVSLMSLDEVSLVSIEDRITSFDGRAARESISFFQKGMKELNFPGGSFCAVPHYGVEEDSGESEYDEEEERQHNDAMNILNLRDEGDDTMSPLDLLKRRDLWRQQQQRMYGTLVDDAENVEVVLHDDVENDDHATESSRLIGNQGGVQPIAPTAK